MVIGAYKYRITARHHYCLFAIAIIPGVVSGVDGTGVV